MKEILPTDLDLSEWLRSIEPIVPSTRPRDEKAAAVALAALLVDLAAGLDGSRRQVVALLHFDRGAAHGPGHESRH